MKASGLIRPKWDLHHLSHNPEHDLFESVIVEFTDISGIECLYYIRDESIEKDWLYGESDRTRYLEPKITRLIYEPTEEPTLTTGFGINSEEVISWASLPKLTLTRDVSAGYHPKPGDAIITMWNDRAYEIADVSEEEKIFQLKKMIWGFVLRPYRFSEESQSAERISRFNRPPSPHLSTDRDVVNSHGHDNEIPHTDTGTLTTPLTAYGDNEEIEDESDEIFDYSQDPDIDSTIYGY
jgi:hypothetical protein